MDDVGQLSGMDDVYTLLGVRADGVAPVVDLIADAGLPHVMAIAEAMLKEHTSCQIIEVWRDGAILQTLARA